MKEIKYWIKKYSTYIIVFLLAVLLIKSCKSCSTERLNNYNIKQREIAYSNDIDNMIECAEKINEANPDAILFSDFGV